MTNIQTYSHLSYHNPLENIQRIEDFEMRYQLSYRIENTMDLNQFELIMTLGEGSFGEIPLSFVHILHIYLTLGRVLLVILESNRTEYALKVLDKSEIVKYKQIEHIQSEIRILNAIKHPNIIIMYSLFQDNSYIYVLMEYVSGDKYENSEFNI
jgi:serine/threonine protein kinase